jgi:ubiquinone/menaquinone biosynthesis C-methylase UbiE
MVVNRYDHIAFLYDRLSNILGKGYKQSKLSFIEELKKGDKVLFLGGGTGGNLPEILDRIGKDGKLFYMESSFRMIEKAKKKVHPIMKSRIKFLHQSNFSDIPLIRFEVIFTQYFLDILTDKEIHQLFQEIKKRSQKTTKWIFVDFFEVNGKKWLLEMMILFFRLVTSNPRRDLPDYERYFTDYGWEVSHKKFLDKEFIQAWLIKSKLEENGPSPRSE